MRRFVVYALTMLCVVVTLNIVINVVCALLGIDITGTSFTGMFVLSVIFGFASSVIGLFLSKPMVIRSMGVNVIKTPSTQVEAWLQETVRLLAAKKGVKCPQVGIYHSPEMNAFATGWNKDDALVAVSTGLLERMEQDEIEAVLGHEMSHVSNGDMVTMCLAQGAVNTIAYMASWIIAGFMRGENRAPSFLVQHLCLMLFNFLGCIVVNAFSRWREYRADAGSAEVLGTEPMIKALEALKYQTVDTKPDEVKAMCISGSNSFMELFMTHPPLEKRIAALKQRRN